MEIIIAEHFTAPGKYEIDLAMEEHRRTGLMSKEEIDKSVDRLNSILNPQTKKPNNDYLNSNYLPPQIKYNRTQNK